MIVAESQGWLNTLFCFVSKMLFLLLKAIDGADTGEGPAGVTLPVLKPEDQELDRHLYHGGKVRASIGQP